MLLTTYGMVLHNADELATASQRGGLAFSDIGDDRDDDSCTWDVMFLDEVGT